MSTRSTLRAVLPRVASVDHRRAAVAVTALAAATLAGRFLAALTVNVPTAPATAPVGVLTPAATALAAVAALVVGLTERNPMAGVGLLFVGVFGLLSLVSSAVTTPAAVAVVAGTAVVTVAHRDQLDAGTGAVAGLLGLALAVGLASGVGGVASLRPLASTLALAGIGVTPVLAATDTSALVRGCLAFGAVVVVGLSMPFVAGAVTLVGTGAVGTSLPVVALAAGGAVTTASAAGRERRWALLAAVALLAFAGVPVTLGRAVPFALGVAALVSLEVGR